MAITCRTCCRLTRPCTGPTRPAARRGATRGRPSPATPGPYTGPVPMVTHVHGAAGVQRRERWLRRGVVPARCQQHPGRLRHRGHLVRLLQGKAAANYGATWGPGHATFQYPNTQPRLDHLVPRPHAGHDAAQRLCRPRGLLHHPRRPGGRWRRARLAHRHGGRAARPRAQGKRQVPVQQDLLRDPDRHPGPRVQRRWLALLPGHARLL